MPYMLSQDGEVRFIRQDLVEQMRKAGWSFTTQRPDEDADTRGDTSRGRTATTKEDIEDSRVIAQMSDNTILMYLPGDGPTPGRHITYAEALRGQDGFPRLPSGLTSEWLQTDAYWSWRERVETWWFHSGVPQDSTAATGRAIWYPDAGDFGIGDDDDTGGGGGGRRGSVGPEYRPPPRDAIEESIKNYLVAVTGTLHQGILNQAVDEFLKQHRAQFDGAAVDPYLSAQKLIRNTSIYKDVHSLRPESDDEMSWVTRRQGKLRQMGVSAESAETLGIQLARVGANQEAVARAGENTFIRSTGRMHRDQRERTKQAASAALGIV
jgi:hypothetical protein